MASMLTGLIAIAFFIVILNGFAAGLVSFAHFFRGAEGVMKRALIGACGTGVVCVALMSGALLFGGAGGGEGAAVIVMVCAIVAAFGAAVSLPGAYILSRKIGDAGRIDPDTFS